MTRHSITIIFKNVTFMRFTNWMVLQWPVFSNFVRKTLTNDVQVDVMRDAIRPYKCPLKVEW